MDITEPQWALLKPLIPKEHTAGEGRGRPARSSRDVLNGVLWVLRTGAPWHDLPTRYPPYQTCHRRFKEWVENGVLEEVLRTLLLDLLKRGQIDLSEAFIDGSFTSAKKGALALVKLSGAKGARSWQSQTAMVFLSPSGLAVLRHMKSHWSNLPLTNS